LADTTPDKTPQPTTDLLSNGAVFKLRGALLRAKDVAATSENEPINKKWFVRKKNITSAPEAPIETQTIETDTDPEAVCEIETDTDPDTTCEIATTNTSPKETKQRWNLAMIAFRVIVFAIMLAGLFLITRNLNLANNEEIMSCEYEYEYAYDYYIPEEYAPEEPAQEIFAIHLSAEPGFHDEEFYLTVTVTDAHHVTVYFTIDGNEPKPGVNRYIERDGYRIQVSGRLPETGTIWVSDRTGYWRNAILAHYSDVWSRTSDVLPAEGAHILQGTGFRFRGFVGDVPATHIVTATYIIAPDAPERFSGRPVIMVTAPYEDFVYIYSNSNRFDQTARRRIFHYEYFENGPHGYRRIFDMPGSTSLGGSGSRDHAQRTLNVHVARGELNNVITHPIFPGLYELYRFRLWNGSNSFLWDHMRDPFAQTAAAGLNVPFSDNNLAIKFINGEYWGFTTIREHTSNAHFVSTRTGVDRANVVIMDDNNNDRRNEYGRTVVFMEVAAGPYDRAMELYEELIGFATSHDMSTDYARKRLFDEFFCKDNFIDYLITQTFFHNTDWPHHNTRIFRAIRPDPASGNPYNDGRWRFIMHDLDAAPMPGAPRFRDSLFHELYELHPWVVESRASEFGYVYLVFNNLAFVEAFVERALYVLDTHFYTDRLIELHDEFLARYRPLLPEMYNRFALMGTVQMTITHFEYHERHLRTFLVNRQRFYRGFLDELLDRLAEEEYTPVG